MSKNKQDFKATWEIIKWLEEDKENNKVLNKLTGNNYVYNSFVLNINLVGTNAINWNKLIPKQKEMMAEDEVFAFIFKHRDKILLNRTSGILVDKIMRIDISDKDILLDDGWLKIGQIIKDYKYTLSTDIDNVEWKGWEK